MRKNDESSSRHVIEGPILAKHKLQWQDANLRQAVYCRQQNLDQNRFSYHKLKPLKSTEQLPVKYSDFICLPLPQASLVDTPLTLHFANGMKLSGIDHTNLATVELLAQVLS